MFIHPAIQHLLKKNHSLDSPIVVGEFGLGPGTNWLFWSLGAKLNGFRSQYFAIEKDPTSFSMGLQRWRDESLGIKHFLQLQGFDVSEQFILDFLEEETRPTIYKTLHEAQQRENLRANVWFHDPFGFDVNPEGYEVGLLQECQKLWADSCWGASYACNKTFKSSLEELAPKLQSVNILPTHDKNLKRERLEFLMQ